MELCTGQVYYDISAGRMCVTTSQQQRMRSSMCSSVLGLLHHRHVVMNQTTVNALASFRTARMAAASTASNMTPTPHWDPFTAPSEWVASAAPVRCTSRIKKDLKSLYDDAPVGLFMVPDENDITRLHALVIGPPETPYAGGFFYFVLRCPPDYPIQPPRVRSMTTDGGRVRFNPNLYADGKVCLSILGTWEGPPWSPASSLSCVLLSIQSLMNEQPINNEPGYNYKRTDPESIKYNKNIAYQTMRVAVCGQLNRKPTLMPQSLAAIMRQWFLDNYESTYVPLLDGLKDVQSLYDPYRDYVGGRAKQTVINVPALANQAKELYAKLVAE